MNISETEFKYMKEFITRDMACMLIRDFGMTMEQALRAVYNSRTFELLGNPESGFYYQSPQYVYWYLKEEVKTGKFSPSPTFDRSE